MSSKSNLLSLKKIYMMIVSSRGPRLSQTDGSEQSRKDICVTLELGSTAMGWVIRVGRCISKVGQNGVK